MQARLFEFLNLRRLPAGRAAFALAKMYTILNAAAGAPPELVARVAEARAAAKATSHMDLRWMHSREQTSTARGSAVQVDREIDQTVKAIVKRLEGDAVGKADAPEVVAAKHLLEHLFPGGLKAVTQQAFDLQLDAIDTILDRLEVELAPEVQTLNLHRQVHDLRSLNEAFRVELDRDNGRVLEWKTVTTQRDTLHYTLCEVVVAALCYLREPTPDNIALLDKIFVPLLAQQKALIEANSQKRRVRDVNPTSGEELDTDTGVDENEVTQTPQPSEV